MRRTAALSVGGERQKAHVAAAGNGAAAALAAVTGPATVTARVRPEDGGRNRWPCARRLACLTAARETTFRRASGTRSSGACSARRWSTSSWPRSGCPSRWPSACCPVTASRRRTTAPSRSCIELLPFFGLAAFTLLLPMTGVILLGIALVVLSYREVVTVYTRAGGSYVVARENFGPRVAQVAAVALMVDYVVTVAVQTAAGSAAILSDVPGAGQAPGRHGDAAAHRGHRDPDHVLREPAGGQGERAGRSRSRPTCSPARSA